MSGRTQRVLGSTRVVMAAEFTVTLQLRDRVERSRVCDATERFGARECIGASKNPMDGLGVRECIGTSKVLQHGLGVRECALARRKGLRTVYGNPQLGVHAHQRLSWKALPTV